MDGWRPLSDQQLGRADLVTLRADVDRICRVQGVSGGSRARPHATKVPLGCADDATVDDAPCPPLLPLGAGRDTSRRSAEPMILPKVRDFVGQHGMPGTLLARPGPSHTSPRTNLVRPPMRSRPRVLPRQRARAMLRGDSSANGSVTSSRRRFASSCSTTSGRGTTSAGLCLTAEQAGVRPLSNVRIGPGDGPGPLMKAADTRPSVRSGFRLSGLRAYP